MKKVTEHDTNEKDKEVLSKQTQLRINMYFLMTSFAIDLSRGIENHIEELGLRKI